MENKKYYTRSNGERIDIDTMETTHLINSLSKKYREVFESTDKNNYSQKFQEINDLKENLYKRFNTYYESLGDK